MLSNEVYDLIAAIQNKSEALSIYDTYIKDAKGCDECVDIWNQLKKHDEEDLDRLTKELEKIARSGQLMKGTRHAHGTTSTSTMR